MLPEGAGGDGYESGWGHLIVAMLFLAAFAFITWESLSFPRLARMFPLLMGAVGVAIAGLQVVAEQRAFKRSKEPSSSSADNEDQAETQGSTWQSLGPIAWLGSYFLAVALLGFLIGSGSYVFIALLMNARLPAYKALFGALTITGAVFLISYFLNLNLPSGLLGL
jgi:hypothetical protein